MTTYRKFTSKDLSRVSNKDKYQFEMDEIQKWLSDNDYIVNKHSCGELSDIDAKWTNYLETRKTKLARYNELELLL